MRVVQAVDVRWDLHVTWQRSGWVLLDVNGDTGPRTAGPLHECLQDLLTSGARCVVVDLFGVRSCAPVPRSAPGPGAGTATSPALPVHIERAAPGIVVVTPAGEVDVETGSHLRRHLDAALDEAGCRALVVDLNLVTSLGTCGLTILVETQDRARERRVPMRLVVCSHAVAHPLAVTGLDDRLAVCHTRAEALAASRSDARRTLVFKEADSA